MKNLGHCSGKQRGEHGKKSVYVGTVWVGGKSNKSLNSDTIKSHCITSIGSGESSSQSRQSGRKEMFSFSAQQFFIYWAKSWLPVERPKGQSGAVFQWGRAQSEIPGICVFVGWGVSETWGCHRHDILGETGGDCEEPPSFSHVSVPTAEGSGGSQGGNNMLTVLGPT